MVKVKVKKRMNAEDIKLEAILQDLDLLADNVYKATGKKSSIAEKNYNVIDTGGSYLVCIDITPEPNEIVYYIKDSKIRVKTNKKIMLIPVEAQIQNTKKGLISNINYENGIFSFEIKKGDKNER